MGHWNEDGFYIDNEGIEKDYTIAELLLMSRNDNLSSSRQRGYIAATKKMSSREDWTDEEIKNMSSRKLARICNMQNAMRRRY
jgi:hypothetical protein